MGKIGFVLGGGGSRGAYEVGVWQALRELGIKIDIVTGTSVGAINGALVCQGAFDLAVSLWKALETHMVFDKMEGKNSSSKFDFNIDIGGMAFDQLNAYAKEILTKGGADPTGLKKLLSTHLKEDTIRNSPMDFGLVAVEYPSMKPTYLKIKDIPEGQLSDYILASAACFPALKIHEVGGKKFIDGAYTDNLPINLALEMGATSIIAVNLETIGIIPKSNGISNEEILTISCPWDLGNFLVFDKINSSRIMRLGYLDAFKKFGIYGGNYYTFAKDDFTRKDLVGADAAAKIFQLNPELIYKKQVFNEYLKAEIVNHSLTVKNETGLGSEKRINLLAWVKSEIAKAQHDFNPKSITLELADNIKNQVTSRNLFLARATKKLLNDEISAADYIVKAGLL